jgi:hypothetical protein
MTIQKVTDTTEIKRGQWVCPQSLFADRLCGRPRAVVKASGQRVYLAEEDGRNVGSFIKRGSCVYVCDTAEEAQAVHAISEEQDAALTAATKAIRAAHVARVEALNGAMPA